MKIHSGRYWVATLSRFHRYPLVPLFRWPCGRPRPWSTWPTWTLNTWRIWCCSGWHTNVWSGRTRWSAGVRPCSLVEYGMPVFFLGGWVQDKLAHIFFQRVQWWCGQCQAFNCVGYHLASDIRMGWLAVDDADCPLDQGHSGVEQSFSKMSSQQTLGALLWRKGSGRDLGKHKLAQWSAPILFRWWTMG